MSWRPKPVKPRPKQWLWEFDLPKPVKPRPKG